MTRLLGPAEIRGLAAELNIRPTKKWGQNFVHDPNTVRRIVELADVTAEDSVLEVGPGLGSLTLGLLATGAKVTAVEIDPVLAKRLPVTAAEYAPETADHLTVRPMDALNLKAEDFVTGNAPTTLVANLPYNVAVPVVLHLLGELPTLTRALVMVQTEVADRMAAAPGGRIYGVPSVKLAWYGRAKKVAAVPRSVFWPVPNVDSALVSFVRGARAADGYAARETPQTHRSEPVVRRETLFALVDAAFSQRRKTLRSALAGWVGSADAATALMLAAEVDPQARGEQLAIEDFIRIARQADAAEKEKSM